MQTVPLKEFFNTDVRGFSIYDCVRSIPSGVDGFKPSMRKIVFGMRKKYPNEEVKVSIAAATVQSVSAFHHGSLEGTMVKMAQSFTGSNNVPFLQDIGQFGSRISPEASATRYIFTKLTDACNNIFHKDDEDILEYLEDDGMSIEPKFYLPIVPTVLLNGSDGMGTGFACRILNYSPADLIAASVDILKGKQEQQLTPWYRGYTGTVTMNGNQVVFTGKFDRVSTTQIHITELPIGQYTSKYREVLNALEDSGLVKTYDDNSSENKTSFVVTCPRDTLRKTDEELLKLFKLIGRETENFTVWTENEHLHKFASANDLLRWFVQFRVSKYEERRLKNIEKLSASIEELSDRIKFIEYYINNSTTVSKMSKAAFVQLLTDMGFKYIDDLLAIRVYNLTADQINALIEKKKGVEAELAYFVSSTARDMYLKDLKELGQFFNKHYK